MQERLATTSSYICDDPSGVAAGPADPGPWEALPCCLHSLIESVIQSSGTSAQTAAPF